MKKFLPFVFFLLFALPVSAATTLYEYYQGSIPALSARAVIYNHNISPDTYSGTAIQNTALLTYLQGSNDIKLGSFNPTGGGTYRIQSSIGSSDTTVSLSSFKEPVSNIPYTMTYLNSTIEYGTLEPGNNTKKEFISFTGITQNADGTASLTGVSRGLSFSYPYTASTTLQQTHSGQSIFILSNPPQLTNQYLNKNNDETVQGSINFYQVPFSLNGPGTTTTSFALRSEVIAASIANAVPAATTTLGYVSIAAPWQYASSTWSSNATTTVDARSALQAGNVTIGLSPVATSSIVATDIGYGGKINPNLIATSSTSIYNFGGPITFNTSTSTFNNSVIFTNPASSSPSWYALDQSATDAYAIQVSPSPTSYAFGMRVSFKANATNTLDSTINVNNLGAKTIKTKNGVDTRTGDIRPSSIAQLIYDGTNFILQNPQQASYENANSTQIYSGQACSNIGWTTLQLGYLSGTTTSLIMLRVSIAAGNVDYLGFRTTGSSASTSAGIGFISQQRTSGNNNTIGEALVKTNSSGSIDWACGQGGSGTFNLFYEGTWNN